MSQRPQRGGATTENQAPSVTVYGAGWCPDVRRSRALLDGDAVPYTYVDVEQDESAAERVRGLQGGECRIPTIVLPDGSFLVEPSDDSLREALARTG